MYIFKEAFFYSCAHSRGVINFHVQVPVYLNPGICAVTLSLGSPLVVLAKIVSSYANYHVLG